MITIYGKEKDGQYCRMRMKNMDCVNLVLMSLCEGELELGYKFKLISKEEFYKVAKNKETHKRELSYDGVECGIATMVWK